MQSVPEGFGGGPGDIDQVTNAAQIGHHPVYSDAIVGVGRGFAETRQRPIAQLDNERFLHVAAVVGNGKRVTQAQVGAVQKQFHGLKLRIRANLTAFSGLSLPFFSE